MKFIINPYRYVFVFSDTITVNKENYNLRTAALAVGWDGSAPLLATVTLDTGIYVWSDDVTIAAFASGAMPAGSTLAFTNLGYVMGRGGDGYGAGGGAVDPEDGGDAMDLDADLITTITNGGGYILGGGGGGGGWYASASAAAGGGGGAGGGSGGYSGGGGHSGPPNTPSSGALPGGPGAGAVGLPGVAGVPYNNGGYIACGGGGGGRIYNGAGGSTPPYCVYAGGNAGGSANGGGVGGAFIASFQYDNYTGGLGGGPGVAGSPPSGASIYLAGGGGGGGGWGAAGGNGRVGINNYSGGAAGKAIELNGGSAPTWISGSGSPRVLGAVS